MIANDDQLTGSLSWLHSEPADADLERRVIKFQDALRRMSDDPREAARIHAIAADAERQQPATDDSNDSTIEVPASGTICLHHCRQVTVNLSPVPAVGTAEPPALPSEELTHLTQLRKELEEVLETMPHAEPHPQKTREHRLGYGSIPVAALAAAMLAALLHASTAAVSIVSIILAATLALVVMSSLLMAWTSVRALNRRGDAHQVLSLLLRGGTAVLRAPPRRPRAPRRQEDSQPHKPLASDA